MTRTVYATAQLAPRSDGVDFAPGDEIQHHYPADELEWLLEHDHASLTRPDDVTPTYSLIEGLSYTPPNAGTGLRRTFEVGERVDGALPGGLVRRLAALGQVGYDPPGGAE